MEFLKIQPAPLPQTQLDWGPVFWDLVRLRSAEPTKGVSNILHRRSPALHSARLHSPSAFRSCRAERSGRKGAPRWARDRECKTVDSGRRRGRRTAAHRRLGRLHGKSPDADRVIVPEGYRAIKGPAESRACLLHDDACASRVTQTAPQTRRATSGARRNRRCL